MESGFALGGGIGIQTAHFNRSHDLAIVSIHVGRALGPNWEVLGELFGGQQLNPTPRSLVGATPVIRYNFATGTAWLPFVDGGVGLTYTSIRDDDLSTPLEFNLHLGTGAHFFLDEGRAVTIQCRFFHLSNAYTKRPNRGANTLMIYAGMSWFF
jgi:lipid A 3-O-deacylase